MRDRRTGTCRICTFEKCSVFSYFIETWCFDWTTITGKNVGTESITYNENDVFPGFLFHLVSIDGRSNYFLWYSCIAEIAESIFDDICINGFGFRGCSPFYCSTPPIGILVPRNLNQLLCI